MSFWDFFVMWCVVYTVADLIHWAYYYIKKYQNRQEPKEYTYEDRPRYRILTPDLFGQTISRIVENANFATAGNFNDDFFRGRKAAYTEIVNIIKKDFAAYEADFTRWNPNHFSHTTNSIVRHAAIAVDKASSGRNIYLNGCASAYFEVIDILVSDFKSYGVNLEEYGLAGFE